jgi:hypothetical protein
MNKTTINYTDEEGVQGSTEAFVVSGIKHQRWATDYRRYFYSAHRTMFTVVPESAVPESIREALPFSTSGFKIRKAYKAHYGETFPEDMPTNVAGDRLIADMGRNAAKKYIESFPDLDAEEELQAYTALLLQCPARWVKGHFAKDELAQIAASEGDKGHVYTADEIAWQLAVDLMNGDKQLKDDLTNPSLTLLRTFLKGSSDDE